MYLPPFAQVNGGFLRRAAWQRLPGVIRPEIGTFCRSRKTDSGSPSGDSTGKASSSSGAPRADGTSAGGQVCRGGPPPGEVARSWRLAGSTPATRSPQKTSSAIQRHCARRRREALGRSVTRGFPSCRRSSGPGDRQRPGWQSPGTGPLPAPFRPGRRAARLRGRWGLPVVPEAGRCAGLPN